MLFECNSGIRLLLLLLWILGVLDKSIFRHCNWSRDALVLGVFRTVQIHGRRPKKTPRKKTERLSRFVWRRSAGLPRTSAEKLICVQMARSPISDIHMRWFQFEELDIEVTYNTSEDERNRSYESKVMAILLKCVRAVLEIASRGKTLERLYGRSSGLRIRGRGFLPRTGLFGSIFGPKIIYLYCFISIF